MAVLTLSRPDRLNAMTPAMHREYRVLLAGAAADPAVGAVVVTGAGRGFCAGADTGALSAIAADGHLPPGAGGGTTGADGGCGSAGR